VTAQAILETIRSRGYWRVRLHPAQFSPAAFPRLKELEEAVRSSVVQVRGWDYPHWPRPDPVRAGETIEASTDWEDHKEYWKAFLSGQFIHFFGMREDWFRDNSGIRRIDIAPLTALSFDSAVYSFSEIFLFAGRWAARIPGATQMALELTLHGLKGRRLHTFDFDRIPFDDRHKAAIEEWHSTLKYDTARLIAEPLDLAVEQVSRLFEQFHWDPAPETIRSVQRTLRQQST